MPRLKEKLLTVDLVTAIQAGDLKGVKASVNANPHALNVLDSTGVHPLWWAMQGKNVDIFLFLLKKGADPNLPNRLGVTVRRHLIEACAPSDPIRQTFLKTLEPTFCELLCCCLPLPVRFSQHPTPLKTTHHLTGMTSGLSLS